MLSLQLFSMFFSDSFHLVSADLGKKLAKEKEQQKLLSQIWKYYLSERRHLLRCVKHLFEYWQDSSHPYRVRGRGWVGVVTPRTALSI